MTAHLTREEWYQAAIHHLRRIIESCGHQLPAKLRVSCGFPISDASARQRRTIGECFSPSLSSDRAVEIFISPVLDDPVVVLSVLLHELIHAAVGNKFGHKGPFRQVALAVGLLPPMRATVPSSQLKVRLHALTHEIGAYPHKALSLPSRIKKQGTRMILLQCSHCGYLIRTTRKWIECYHGKLPICPCGSEFVRVPQHPK